MKKWKNVLWFWSFQKISRNFEKKFKKEKVFIWSKSKRMKKQSAEDRVGTIMISCITTSFSSKYSLSTKSYWEYIKLTLMFLYLWSLRFICIDFVLLVSDFKTPKSNKTSWLTSSQNKIYKCNPDFNFLPRVLQAHLIRELGMKYYLRGSNSKRTHYPQVMAWDGSAEGSHPG